MNLNKNSDGAVLVMVMVMLVVGSILVTTLLASSRNYINTAEHEEAMSKSFYAANSGVEFIKSKINNIDFSSAKEGEYIIVDNNGNIDSSNIEIITQDDLEDNEEIWIDSDNLDGFDSNINFNIEIININGTGNEVTEVTIVSQGKYNKNGKEYTKEIEFSYSFEESGRFAGITEKGEVYILTKETNWNDFSNETPILEEGEFNGDIYGGAWNQGSEILAIAGDQNGRNDIFESSISYDNWNEVNFHGGGINHIRDINYYKENKRFYTINHNGKIHEAYKENGNWITNNIGKTDNFNGDIESTVGNNKLVFAESNNSSNSIYTFDLSSNNNNGNKNNNEIITDINDMVCR